MDKKEIVSIENERLKVSANLYGGGLCSVFDKQKGEELLFQGDKKSWDGQDVVIFPLVARLQDGYYLHGGKRYDIKIHGLARYTKFAVEEKTDDRLTVLFVSSEDTLKQYPFPFEFRVTYSIKEGTLYIAHSVVNTGEGDMYFQSGAHPAFILDAEVSAKTDDTSGNYIVFDTPMDNAQYYTLTPDATFILGQEDFGKLDKIELAKELFQKYGTLILKNSGLGFCLERKNGRKLRFDIADAPILAFWSMPDFGAYVCVEPWLGLPDFDPPKRELKDKAFVRKLQSGSKFGYRYSITI